MLPVGIESTGRVLHNTGLGKDPARHVGVRGGHGGQGYRVHRGGYQNQAHDQETRDGFKVSAYMDIFLKIYLPCGGGEKRPLLLGEKKIMVRKGEVFLIILNTI